MTQEELDYLRSEEGRTIFEEYFHNLQALQAPERLIMKLRKKYPTQVGAVVHQIKLHHTAQEKLGDCTGLILTQAGVEQSTRRELSQYVAQRFSGFEHVTDGTAGIGADARYIVDDHGTVVEIDPVIAQILEHNLSIWRSKSSIKTLAVDSQQEDISWGSAVYLDPARRDGEGRRTSQVALWNPNLYQIIPKIVSQTPSIGIKISPATDWDQIDALQVPYEGEVIAWKFGTKQIMIWTGTFVGEVTRRATILPSGWTLTDQDSRKDIPTVPIGMYVVEPNNTVMRAGLIDQFCTRYQCHKLDPHIGYLTTNTPPEFEHDHIGRTYRVIDMAKYNVKQLKKILATYHIDGVEIRRRGFPETPDEVRKKLGLPDGNDLTLLLTRIGPSLYSILCEKVTDQQKKTLKS